MFDTTDLAQFRQTVARFVQEQLPDDLRQTVRQGQQPSREQLLGWHARLAQAGLLVPH